MKRLVFLTAFFLVSFNSLSAQEIGIINDPDGYTNIRNGKGTKYEIIGKIQEGERFQYFKSNQTEWWKINTMPYFGDPIIGYIHKSRIQPFNIKSNSECNCLIFDNNVLKKPDLIAKVGNTILTVCGFLMQRYSENSIKISEFSITDCSANKMMKFYGAVKVCNVTYSDEKLEIIELDRLPAGKGFQWIEIPYKRTIISNELDYPKFSNPEIIIDLSQISKADVVEFEQGLPSYKGKGYVSGIETFIGKLAICALKGSSKSEKIFNDIDNYLDFVLDGAFREFYNDAQKILEESKAL